MKVKDIMTRPVIVAAAETPAADVAALLSRHRISAVPITDASGAVVGLDGRALARGAGSRHPRAPPCSCAGAAPRPGPHGG